MASWTTYKGLDVPDTTTGDAGSNLKGDLELLADRAPFYSSSDPDDDSDSAHDFVSGSQWFNTTSEVMWICVDDAVGAAKWRSLYKRIENAIVLAPAAGITGSDARSLQFDDGGDNRGDNAIDLQRIRANGYQVASGNNSAILSGENNTSASSDSVVTGGTGNIAGGVTKSITNISVAFPTIVTSNAHGLVTSQLINFSGTNSTPSIDGEKTVIVIDPDTFSVNVNVTGAGNAGNWSTTSIALNSSVGGGENNQSISRSSHVAGGTANKALGRDCHAEGWNSVAGPGRAAHAEGSYCQALGIYSHAEGYKCNALSDYAHAQGTFSTAAGAASHAEGALTTASGTASHSQGFYSHAGASYAHAEGKYTQAIHLSCHAEGHFTTASGFVSHAEGYATTASGYQSHAGGKSSKAHLTSQWARASGGHSDQQGTAQTTITQLFRATSGATATELTIDGDMPSSANRFTILDGQTLSCFVNIVGRKVNGSTNDNASFLRQLLIRRESSTTELVDWHTVGIDINPNSWGGVSISADDTNDCLKIEIAGLASTDIRWMATVFASEVADAAI